MVTCLTLMPRLLKQPSANRRYAMLPHTTARSSRFNQAPGPRWQTKVGKERTLCPVPAELGGRLLKKNNGEGSRN